MRKTEAGAAAALSTWVMLYLAWLFIHPEPELWHWLTLVGVPLAVAAAIERPPSLGALLASIGLDRTRAARGLGWAILLGGAITLVQLLNRRQLALLLDVLGDPVRVLLVPLAFVLLMGTAAFTEEVFFRGLLLTRVRRVAGTAVALVSSSLVFGLYHVPYLLRDSADLGAALRGGLVLGVIGGLPLGGVYLLAGGNLVAAMLAHALFDLVPATAYLARLFP